MIDVVGYVFVIDSVFSVGPVSIFFSLLILAASFFEYPSNFTPGLQPFCIPLILGDLGGQDDGPHDGVSLMSG